MIWCFAIQLISLHLTAPSNMCSVLASCCSMRCTVSFVLAETFVVLQICRIFLKAAVNDFCRFDLLFVPSIVSTLRFVPTLPLFCTILKFFCCAAVFQRGGFFHSPMYFVSLGFQFPRSFKAEMCISNTFLQCFFIISNPSWTVFR